MDRMNEAGRLARIQHSAIVLFEHFWVQRTQSDGAQGRNDVNVHLAAVGRQRLPPDRGGQNVLKPVLRPLTEGGVGLGPGVLAGVAGSFQGTDCAVECTLGAPADVLAVWASIESRSHRDARVPATVGPPILGRGGFLGWNPPPTPHRSPSTRQGLFKVG